MIRLIIADSHLGQRPGDAAEMCALLRRSADRGVGEVIFLGDTFQYLIGMPKFWTAAVRGVLAVWDELRARGIRVVLIEGNRDFFLDEPGLSDRVDVVGRSYEFTNETRRYRLVHGDRVNLRDHQYRFWSAVSKSRIARIWARLLPRPIAVGIVTHMEARLAKTNRKFRYRKPVADFRRTAAEAWAEGIDILLWGHFHTLWTIHDGDRLAMVVPAWLETEGSVLVADDGSWQWVDTNLEPTEIPEPNNGLRGDGP